MGDDWQIPPLGIAPNQHDLFSHRISKVTGRLKVQLDIEFASNPFRALDTRFVIATCGGRVGSHLLCQELLQHGAFVNEFFHVNRILRICKRSDILSLEDYCRNILRRHATNGVFGVKGDAKVLAPMILAGEFPDFCSEWRFVYLTRDDIVKQAISQLKAELTGAWRSSQQPSRELNDGDFDRDRIASLIDEKLETSDTWEESFKLFGITPLRVTYETLAADPTAAASRVADFLALKGHVVPQKRFKAPVQVQADELSARWDERFRHENAAFCADREARSV